MYFGCKWLVATQLFVTGPEDAEQSGNKHQAPRVDLLKSF